MKRKHIALQPEDYSLLSAFSKAIKKPLTKSITYAIETVQEVLHALFSSKLDTALWYCEKIAFSVQMLKEKKSKEQLQRLMKLLEHVEERYNIDANFMKEVAEGFINGNCDVIFINEALKELMKDIVRTIILGDKVKLLKALVEGKI